MEKMIQKQTVEFLDRARFELNGLAKATKFMTEDARGDCESCDARDECPFVQAGPQAILEAMVMSAYRLGVAANELLAAYDQNPDLLVAADFSFLN